MTQARELSFIAADGTLLYVADWPVGSATAAGDGIVFMHGLGEHCGRYVHLARFFNDCGYAVRTYDHRGHGRSGGTRGDVPDTETLLQDAKIAIDDFAQKLSAPPLLPDLFPPPQAPTTTEQPKASQRSGRYTRICKVCHRALATVTYHGTIPLPTVESTGRDPLQPGVRLSVLAPV